MYYFVKVETETPQAQLLASLEGVSDVVGHGIGTASFPSALWFVLRGEHPSAAAVQALVTNFCEKPEGIEVRSADSILSGVAQFRQLALL